jgi:hypothetical protein
MSFYDDPPPFAPERSAGKWLGLSIASTLLCCLPLGIVGIVYAAMALDAESRGDWVMAASRTQTAKTWTTWSFVLGLIVIVLYVCLLLNAGDSYSGYS